MFGFYVVVAVVEVVGVVEVAAVAGVAEAAEAAVEIAMNAVRYFVVEEHPLLRKPNSWVFQKLRLALENQSVLALWQCYILMSRRATQVPEYLGMLTENRQ